MKNKKIKQIILLFGVMVLILAGGFAFILFEINSNKISVLVANEEIPVNYELTENDRSKFKIEKREKDDLAKDYSYFDNFDNLLTTSVDSDGYITKSIILKDSVIYNDFFVSKKTQVVDPNVNPAYAKFSNPITTVLNVESASIATNSIVKGTITQIYAYYKDETTNDYRQGILVDKIYVNDIEYLVNTSSSTKKEGDKEIQEKTETKTIQKIEITLETEDLAKVIEAERKSWNLYFFTKGENVKIENVTSPELMIKLGENYTSQETFLPISNELKTILSTEHVPNGKNEIYMSFFDIASSNVETTISKQGIELVWRGSNLKEIYIEHYNFDGSRGLKYGRYSTTVGNVSYDGIYDEYKITNGLYEEGFYQITLYFEEKTKNEAGNLEISKETKMYNFVIENTISYPFITSSSENEINNFTVILNNDNSIDAQTPLCFKKSYFDNIEKLKDKKITKEELFRHLQNNNIEFSFDGENYFKIGEIFDKSQTNLLETKVSSKEINDFLEKTFFIETTGDNPENPVFGNKTTAVKNKMTAELTGIYESQFLVFKETIGKFKNLENDALINFYRIYFIKNAINIEGGDLISSYFNTNDIREMVKFLKNEDRVLSLKVAGSVYFNITIKGGDEGIQIAD